MQAMQDSDFRLRVLEERYSKVRSRLILINQNMLEEFKLFNGAVEKLSQEMDIMRKDMEEIKTVTRTLLKTSQQFAQKKDFLAVEKYINLWNPLHFVTEKEVKELVKAEVAKNRKT
ncbi:hypothetical protein CL622_00625 [archaeon]|nr:hypothetical protein [archaeon]|tara:strand:- start:2005 stop:2352 length:348 start_codon:yes stop_codon:yes gene_type:complete